MIRRHAGACSGGGVALRRTLGGVPASAVTAAAPDTSLVRRARKVNRVLAETYPDARCELDFDDPFQLLVVTVLSAQTTDRRVNAVQPGPVRRLPRRAGDGGAPTRRPRAHDRPARLLPGQDRVDAQAVGAPWSSGTAARCRPGSKDLVELPGRRPQDRQRRARQRVRRPRHHGRHPLRTARPPLRVDRGDRPGQGRARGRCAVPQAGLDDAQPPPDLARTPRSATPRSPACGACPVARLCPSYGEGRPTRRRRPGWSRPRDAHDPRRVAGRRCSSHCSTLLLLAGVRHGEAGPRSPRATLPDATCGRCCPTASRSTSARCAGPWWSTSGRTGAARAAGRCRSTSSSREVPRRSRARHRLARPGPRQGGRRWRRDRGDLPARWWTRGGGGAEQGPAAADPGRRRRHRRLSENLEIKSLAQLEELVRSTSR